MRRVSLARAFWSRAAVTAVAVGVIVLVAPSVSLAAGDANKTQCGLETEASPGFRTYLPDCRAYELVTPPYKASAVVLGEPPEPAAISADGAHVIIGSGGAFASAGNDWWQANRNPNFDAYELTRTAAGWEPTALTPPATEYPHSAIMAASSEDLSTTLWGAATSTVLFNEDIYLRNSSGEFLLVGPGIAPELAGEEPSSSGEELGFAGASRDLTRLLFVVEASSSNARKGHKGHSNLWPGDTTEPGSYSLYEYVGTGNVAPTLVGVSDGSTVVGGVTLPAGQVISRCGTELGTSRAGRSAYNAVSEDGETVFFTARACSGPSEPTVNELYARVGQSKTVAISEPKLPVGECTSGEPCSGAAPKEAIFQGASEDGERVFFLSEQPLVNGAPATGVKLYEARLGGSTVSQVVDVSADATSGQSPKVQGVVRVSENGERVYFVAKAVLSGKDTVAGRSPEEAEPEEEADNLYVYEPDPAHPGAYHTAFVAKLLTSAEEASIKAAEEVERSRIEEIALAKYFAQTEAAQHELEHGEISEKREQELEAEALEAYEAFIRTTPGTRGPSGTLAEDQRVWSAADTRPAQATPDGHFLVFLSSADLTAGDESEQVPQLFEYDAARERLTRVSISQGGGYSNNGNVDTFHDAPQIPVESFSESDLPTAAQSGLALSKDGSRVFFTSAASLTPQAVSGDTSVYEYREGSVYLISDGRDASLYEGSPTVRLFGVDPTGQDALFLTADPLVPQDGETQMVLYDAREEGGFPAPALVPGCAGETCRGSSGATPQLQSPGSASQAGGGNLPPPVESKPAAKSKPKPLTRAQKLAKALKACRARANRKKRTRCEAQARTKYGAKSESKAAKQSRVHRKAGR